MPKPTTKATAPEMVLTATRSCDYDNRGITLLKRYTTAVVRYWITDWKYGYRSEVPFIAIPDLPEDDVAHLWHFLEHLQEAAKALELPVLKIELSQYCQLPDPPVPQSLPFISNWSHRDWAGLWCQVFGALKQDDGGY